MIRLALVCCGLLGTTPTATQDGPAPGLAAYEEARAEAGGGAEGQVRLALWCEEHGLNAERVKHLALAVMIDPGHAAARGLLGLVADGRGRWRRPEEVAGRERADASDALAEYNARRDRTPETADAQWKLALWCESKGLKAEAVAHLTAVVRLDPSRAPAWKRLGCRPHAGRWMTAEQIAAEAAEAEAQSRADRHWRPVFERAKGYLSFKDRSRREKAEADLADVSDPRAVAPALVVFSTGPEAAQRLGVQILGRIDTPASSRGLAEFAVRSRWSSVRVAAAETLRRRDPRDFARVLIARLRDPIAYHVRPVGGPGQSGELLIEGDEFNLDRVYNPPPLPAVPVTPGSGVEVDEDGSLVVRVASAITGNAVFGSMRPAVTEAMRRRNAPNTILPAVLTGLFGPNGGLAALPFRAATAAEVAETNNVVASRSTAVPLGRMVTEIEKAAYMTRGQQRDDVRALERMNGEVRRANDPVVAMLAAVLGETTGSTRSDWERWENDRRGYVLASRSVVAKPTVVDEVNPSYTPAPIGQFVYDRQAGYYIPNRDCFAAGTPVRTLDGPRPIEALKVGDRVLAQDPRTGALGYQPVLAVHHNPPAETLKLDLGGETVVTTGIQRFWKARQGWVMARDLKPGDAVRTLGGLVRVEASSGETTRPVFNLEIAGGHDFFVGTAGVLVHDHTEVEPLDRPFDSPPVAIVAD